MIKKVVMIPRQEVGEPRRALAARLGQGSQWSRECGAIPTPAPARPGQCRAIDTVSVAIVTQVN